MSIFVDLSDETNRIAGLQRMLRTIGLGENNSSFLIPITGVFDTDTETALKLFQSECGLTEDGKYTFEVWKHLNKKFNEVVAENSRSGSIRPYPESDGYEIAGGERSELVFITQLMLNSLRMNYDLPHVPVNGVYDEITMNSVRKFQEKNKLNATGRVDRRTWDKLAEDYNDTVNDNQ